MKRKFKWSVLMLIAIFTINFTSCSGDKNDEPDIPTSAGATANPASVFTNGVPKQVGNMQISTNEDGLVSKITQGSTVVTFSYPKRTKTRSGEEEYDVIFTIDNGYDVWKSYVILNSSGYAAYMKDVWDDDDINEYWIDYNSDTQLNKITVKNDSGKSELNCTYSNGNLTKLKYTYNLPGYGTVDGALLSFDYGTKVIANKGGIIIFDWYGIDEDDSLAYAYYAGILGKTSKSLPVKMISTLEDEDDSVDIYEWSINANGLPTSVTINWTDGEDGTTGTDTMKFDW